jgi:hypothetical protein
VAAALSEGEVKMLDILEFTAMCIAARNLINIFGRKEATSEYSKQPYSTFGLSVGAQAATPEIPSELADAMLEDSIKGALAEWFDWMNKRKPNAVAIVWRVLPTVTTYSDDGPPHTAILRFRAHLLTQAEVDAGPTEAKPAENPQTGPLDSKK